jgi:predicted CXXCH cytochrome family protein
MHAAEVTCSNCHDPHSAKLRAEGNALCAQCHLPEKFEHPGPAPRSIGSTRHAERMPPVPHREFSRLGRRDHRRWYPNGRQTTPHFGMALHAGRAGAAEVE